MADLHYFPLLAADWLSGEAVATMTPEQEGAFVHLLCHCWNANGLSCTLPNDDKALAQLSRLGRRWKTAGRFVRAQFHEVDGDPTRIYNKKLWTVYQEAVAAHERRVDAGKKGGKAKARVYQSPSNATAKPKQEVSNQNQSQITTSSSGGIEKRFSEPAHQKAVSDFLKSLPEGQRSETWEAMIVGWLDGIGLAGNRPATGEDIAVGLADYLATGHTNYSPPHIRKFVERQIKGRKRDDVAIRLGENVDAPRLWRVMKDYGFTTATRFTIDADLARAKADGKITDPEAFKATLRKIDRDALKNARSDQEAERIIVKSLSGSTVEGLAA